MEQLRNEVDATTVDAKSNAAPCRLRRQALPEHLRRVEHFHEPDSTDCAEPGCGRSMTRIGEEMSERLDIVPAEFFVHRHIHGKWACRCCQVLKQAPSISELIEGGMAASGLTAHTLISRCVDHLPYFRQEAISRRAGRPGHGDGHRIAAYFDMDVLLRRRRLCRKVNAIHPGYVRTDMNAGAGAIDVSEGARSSVQIALLDADGPTSTFTHLAETLPWQGTSAFLHDAISGSHRPWPAFCGSRAGCLHNPSTSPKHQIR